MTETPVSDSYITTVEEADAFFAKRLGATAWTGTDKSKALQMATAAIDALPLRGRKFDRDGTQTRQFPREYRDGYDMDEATGEEIVPQAVKDACCLEALALIQFFADSDRTDRKTMQEDGVKNYNLGGVYNEALGPSNTDKHHGLLSSEAYRLLAKHIARSFPIV